MKKKKAPIKTQEALKSMYFKAFPNRVGTIIREDYFDKGEDSTPDVVEFCITLSYRDLLRLQNEEWYQELEKFCESLGTPSNR